MTTSADLPLTGFIGVLAGQGPTFTPVTVVTSTTALLAWPERLAGFSLGLTETELRSAIPPPEPPPEPWGWSSRAPAG